MTKHLPNPPSLTYSQALPPPNNSSNKKLDESKPNLKHRSQTPWLPKHFAGEAKQGLGV